MHVKNAEWRAEKDKKTGKIALYDKENDVQKKGGNIQGKPALVVTVAKFKALAAIIDQIT